MVSIPADARTLRFLLCSTLAVIIALAALVIAASPDRGYCSGIEGSVLKAPSQSVPGASTAPQACPRAVLVIQEAKSDRVVSTVTADERGGFSLRLAPGRYRISLDGSSKGLVPVGEPLEQTVEAGHLAHVTLYAVGKPVAN